MLVISTGYIEKNIREEYDHYLLQPGYYAIIVEHMIAWKLPDVFSNTVIFFTHRTF